MKLTHLTLIIASLLTILVLCIPTPLSTSTTSHAVTINTIDDMYSVEEKIVLDQTNATIELFVQSGINDLSVIINNTDLSPIMTTENIYQINYSQGLNQEQTTLIISYSFPKDTSMSYSKQFVYNTSSFTITLDGKNLASHENLNRGSTLTIQLPEEQDTSKSLNLFSTILIGLLIVLLLVTTMYGIRKRGGERPRNRDVESSELLVTEKSLLMNVLKEIEKKHRDKKISDETYGKLKSYYKQQTVDIMSNLED